ncbi:MAG: hypothetical protein O7E52_01210, partial [Candidatus Poribacteria bacterium]|nr:hypothetical protein [Candidatus Poribacteria bacterium]
SIAMLKKSIASGVTAIVATPHLYPGAYMAPTTYRDQAIAELRSEVERRQLPIEIYPGRECYFSPEIYEYERDLGKLTITDNGKYLLIESPMQEIPQYVDQMIFDLQIKGITPIIAHAERYHDIIVDPNLLHKYIELGCLIQVNVGSVLGKYGTHIQQTARILLEHQMGHIVASDMHTLTSISLGEGFDALVEIVGEEETWCLVEARPRAVIQNRSIHRRDALEYRPKKSFQNLWGLLSKPRRSRDDL